VTAPVWDLEELGRFLSTLGADTLEHEKDVERAENFFSYAKICLDYKKKGGK